MGAEAQTKLTKIVRKISFLEKLRRQEFQGDSCEASDFQSFQEELADKFDAQNSVALERVGQVSPDHKASKEYLSRIGDPILVKDQFGKLSPSAKLPFHHRKSNSASFSTTEAIPSRKKKSCSSSCDFHYFDTSAQTAYQCNGEKMSCSSSPTLPPSNSFSEESPVRNSLKRNISAASEPIVLETFEDSGANSAVICKTATRKMNIPIPEFNITVEKAKKRMRKKKRSSSWYNILSPTYKQKNDAFHKCFKQLEDTERLLVDCTCALMKEILIQGRMYVSQNYVCFHSNILRWQTAVLIKLKDIEQISKVKTAKFIPNAIQFQIKGKEKSPTFSSFTQRDRTYQQIYKLWQNAIANKSFTPQELWSQVHSHYGSDLGCSSDEDYVRPDTRNDASSRSMKEDKKRECAATSLEPSNFGIVTLPNQESEKLSNRDHSSEESKSSSQDSTNDCSERLSLFDNGGIEIDCDVNDVDHAKESLDQTYLERQFQVPVERLFHTIFEDESEFWRKYLEGKRCCDLDFGSWQNGSDDYEGDKVRHLSYNLPLTNPLVPKSSHVEELQVLYKESQSSRCYAVDSIARTYGVPYSDYFSTIMRYCLRKINRTTCELKITAQVKFHKTPWGLVKNFIVKNVHSGMEENFQLLERELVSHFAHSSRPTSLPSLLTTSNRKRSNSALSKSHKQRAVDEPLDSYHTGPEGYSDKEEPSNVPLMDPLNLKSDLNNNCPYVKLPDSASNSTNWKWIQRFLSILFILLLISNYSMYRRINNLELQLHSTLSLDNEQSQTLFGNCLYESSLNRDDLVSTSLRRVQSRLGGLEKLVRNFTIASDRHWATINVEWKELQKTVADFIQLLKKEDRT